ncbi:MAG TPA: hypothetical protein DCR14_10325 [Acidimicrobiaceae bacterium]|nr:hypothetical protein [Acidimicrobiaceae bacterium]
MFHSSSHGERRGRSARSSSEPTRAPLIVDDKLPVRVLLLDPGDELAAAEHPDTDVDPEFLRHFVPMRAYQRLLAADLGTLSATIIRNPEAVDGKVLVRPLADGDERFVVIDGHWQVAALRKLADEVPEMGVELPDDVAALLHACPVRIVRDDADPAFVLSLLAPQPGDDPWLSGQRDRLIARLSEGLGHRSTYEVAIATGGSRAAMRRYHAYRALEQFLQAHPLPATQAATMLPIFHVALARTLVRNWLDWDDHLCAFLDEDALEHFHRMLLPGVDVDGSPTCPCIRTVDDIASLCDVLESPSAKKALLEHHVTLADAVQVIEDDAMQHWMASLGEAIDAIRWDQRRFKARH